jgi:hypothetical protein
MYFSIFLLVYSIRVYNSLFLNKVFSKVDLFFLLNVYYKIMLVDS